MFLVIIMLDVEKLILLVKEHSELYDAKHKNHRNREHIAALWRSIAEKLGVNVLEAKAKWGNLRSNFMREKRKFVLISLRAGSTQKITWPFYEMLTFLEDYVAKVTFPETDGYNDLEEEESMQIKTELNDLHELHGLEDSNDFASGSIYSENFPVVAEASSSSKKRKRDPPPSGEDEIDKINLKDLEKPNSYGDDYIDDADLMFFRSLLPTMKKLGTISNLEFKGEVIQLLSRKLQPPSTNNS